MTDDLLVKVDGLTKYFGPFPAISDISFHANRGEIIGLIGPNGAGKSTTMRILTGILSPTAGYGEISGENLFTRSSEIRRKVGYLMENPPLYPEIPVKKYLDIVGRLKGMKKGKRTEEIEALAEKLELNEVANRPCGKLSKGFRQRVGLAQALLGDPGVLILDEPISGLDPIQIIELREIIKDLAKGRAVIMSSHILQEVAQTCTRLVIISEGKVAATGTSDELSKKLMTGQDRLFVRLKGEEKLINSLLSGLDFIQEFKIIHAYGGGIFDISLTLEKSAHREELSRKIVESKAGLLELRSATMNLEEIFVKLTLGDRR